MDGFGEEEVEAGGWVDEADVSPPAHISPLGRAASRHEIFLRKYVLQETIGQGAFGKVKRAKCRSTHETRAVKIIDKRLIGDIDDVLRYTREFAILNSLNHKNIIHLHEVSRVSNLQTLPSIVH